jgi:hypothetical protein
MKLETIEHARLRALAQVIIDKDKGIEAFEEYMKIAFPYLEATKRRDKEDHIRLLQREVGRGPLKVTPVESPAMKSRMGAAKSRRHQVASEKDRARFYKRLGRF